MGDRPAITQERLGRRGRRALALAVCALVACAAAAAPGRARAELCTGDVCTPTEIEQAFAALRTLIAAHVADGPLEASLLQRATLAEALSLQVAKPEPPPIVPPNPIAPITILLSLDAEVAALTCAQPTPPPITPAGAAAIHDQITALVAVLSPSPPPIRPAAACPST